MLVHPARRSPGRWTFLGDASLLRRRSRGPIGLAARIDDGAGPGRVFFHGRWVGVTRGIGRGVDGRRLGRSGIRPRGNALEADRSISARTGTLSRSRRPSQHRPPSQTGPCRAMPAATTTPGATRSTVTSSRSVRSRRPGRPVGPPSRPSKLCSLRQWGASRPTPSAATRSSSRPPRPRSASRSRRPPQPACRRPAGSRPGSTTARAE